MKTVVIACKTLEEEVHSVMESLSLDYPIVWLESGLHNSPERLHQCLQDGLNKIKGCGRVLMAFGFCGNAVNHLQTGDFTLILPRVDDCISLLLGSTSVKMDLNHADPTYFLSRGWLKGERNIWVEYQYTVRKYGLKTGKEIFDSMFGHYRTLGLMDAGISPLDGLTRQTRLIAQTLGLTHKIIPASTEYLEQLLTGPWPPERFLEVAAHTVIRIEDLYTC